MEQAVAPEAVALGRPRPPAFVVVGALATAALVALPLAYIFFHTLSRGPGAYIESLTDPLSLRLLGQTLALVVGVLVVTWAIALPMAWLVVRTDLPARSLWALVGALPLVFPSYVSAFTLVAALGPRGYARSMLAPLGVERLPDWIYGYSGAVIVLGLFTYPYLFLLLVSALRRLDPAHEESARSLGYGRWHTYFRLVLPQLRPALLAGSLLVVLYTVSDFGAVSIVRFSTFTLTIYNAYQSLFDRTLAATLATSLVLLTVSFLLLEAWLSRRTRPEMGSAKRQPRVQRLGRWKWPAISGLGLIAFFNLMLPLGVIVYWAARAIAVGNPLGSVGPAVVNSLAVSIAAALVAAVLSLPVVFWAVRWRGPVGQVIERVSHAGYALPGLVIALSLVFFATRFARPLYQSVPLLVLAYVCRFFPEALAATRSSVIALSPRFEEAAKSLGRGRWYILVSLILPLIRPGVLAGVGLVFLTAMKELPATLILRPTGFDTLSTRIWQAAAEGIYSQAAIPSMLLLFASGVPVYFLIIRPSLRGSVRL